MLGPQEFASQPIFAAPLWIAGYQLPATPAGFAKEPMPAPAALIAMHSGRTLVQLPYLDSGQGETHGAHYRFRFQARAEDLGEDGWRALLSALHSPPPFYLVDSDAETIVFAAGPELANFTLPRPTAVSVWTEFAALAIPARAWLAGTELVEVSGAPGAGEFRISGSTVEIAPATAGQLLEVRYYPAYQVAPEVLPSRTVEAFGAVGGEVVLVEARA